MRCLCRATNKRTASQSFLRQMLRVDEVHSLAKSMEEQKEEQNGAPAFASAYARAARWELLLECKRLAEAHQDCCFDCWELRCAAMLSNCLLHVKKVILMPSLLLF